MLVSHDLEVFDVDVHHYFEETYSSGKKTDHAMHNVCLDNTISLYRKEFQKRYNRELKNVIVWTDNAPTQYRCRQNFLKVASVAERHKGIQITHRLAVVDNFKGVHDAVGKDCAQLIKNLELIGIRSPNAEAVFKNCYERLEKSDEHTEWKGYEKEKDGRLKNKGRFGMDRRTVWFVVETKEEHERLSLRYPGRILLCDRSFVLDTHTGKAVEGTQQMHELRSSATEVPLVHPLKWPASVANLPCNCISCYNNPLNDQCKYIEWRLPREVQLQIKCLHPKEAERWVGDELVHNIDKKGVNAKAVEFLLAENKWKIELDGGKHMMISYDQFCRGKKRLEKMNAQKKKKDARTK